MEKPMQSQRVKGERFKELHERKGLFVLPNPWDGGSAKILTRLGFEALASTSAGLAFSLGKQDGSGSVTRVDNLANLRSIITATDLPVSGDLENGYGIDPQTCAETILLAADAGLVGGSIEDARSDPENPIYPFDLSVERIKAAAKAARSLPFPFTLTARAENHIHGRPDLKDTIRRLQAFAEAGADVLYAPGLKTRGEIEILIKETAPFPVNVLLTVGDGGLSLGELADLGVKRVSLGSTLARAAYSAFYSAAKEIKQKESFDFGSLLLPYDEINEWFSES